MARWSPTIIVAEIPATWRGGLDNAKAILQSHNAELTDEEIMTRLAIAGIVAVVEANRRITRLREEDFKAAAA